MTLLALLSYLLLTVIASAAVDRLCLGPEPEHPHLTNRPALYPSGVGERSRGRRAGRDPVLRQPDAVDAHTPGHVGGEEPVEAAAGLGRLPRAVPAAGADGLQRTRPGPGHAGRPAGRRDLPQRLLPQGETQGGCRLDGDEEELC